MNLGLAQGNADAEDAAFARGFHAEGDEHRAIEHAAVESDLFITGVDDDIGSHAQGLVAPDLQMSVEFGRALTDLSGTDTTAAKLLNNGRDLAGGDALDILHLSQSQFEGLLAAKAFLQCAGVELHVAAHLRHSDIQGAHAGIDGLGFEAVGVALAGIGALVGLSAKSLGTLAKHGFINENRDASEHAFEAGFIELLQDGVHKFRVVSVGHEGFACCCVW